MILFLPNTHCEHVYNSDKKTISINKLENRWNIKNSCAGFEASARAYINKDKVQTSTKNSWY